MTAEELEAGKRLRPLSRRRRRRHPLPHATRHAPDQGRLLHARHLARPLRRATARRAPTTSTTCSGCCASSRRRRRSCRARRPRRRRADALRRDLFRLDRAGDGRGAGRARRSRASTSTRCASAPSRSPTTVADFIAGARPRFVVEQNRDAQLRTLLVNECGIDPARLVPVLHYDGTPITARFIVDAIAKRAGALDRPPTRGSVPMTYLAKPKLHHPTLPTNALGFTPPRLRGRGLHALRRLRPRLDQRRHHPGLLRARPRAAPRGQALRHRLLVEDADLFPRQLARLQQRARPHAVGADRRQPRQPRPDLSRRLRRRRLRLDRPRPVRPLPCAAA